MPTYAHFLTVIYEIRCLHFNVPARILKKIIPGENKKSCMPILFMIVLKSVSFIPV